jgi:hypothetical protein
VSCGEKLECYSLAFCGWEDRTDSWGEAVSCGENAFANEQLHRTD